MLWGALLTALSGLADDATVQVGFLTLRIV